MLFLKIRKKIPIVREPKHRVLDIFWFAQWKKMDEFFFITNTFWVLYLISGRNTQKGLWDLKIICKSTQIVLAILKSLSIYLLERSKYKEDPAFSSFYYFE